jgi:flagellar basal body-associated protein FliL
MPAEETQDRPKRKDAKLAEADEGAQAQKVEKKNRSALTRKLILGGIIVAVIAVEVVIAYFVVQATKQEDPRVLAEKKAQEQEETSREKLTTMGLTTEPIEVTVNVAGANKEEDHYVKVAIQLEFDDQKYPKLMEQLKLREPRIKNILIESLAGMNLEQLLEPNGKVRLRDLVRNEVNKSLPKDEGSIREVFISQFLVQ